MDLGRDNRARKRGQPFFRRGPASEGCPQFITLCPVKTSEAATADPPPGYGPLPSRRASRRQGHLSSARADLLDILIDQPEPCTVKALSALTGQHPNTTREHLAGLVQGGLAVRSRTSAQRRGRPASLYSAAPEIGSGPGAREYAGLASALAAQIARTSPKPRADSIEAGRAWGRELVRRPLMAAVDVRMAAAVGEGSVPLAANARSAMAARRQVVTLLEKLGFAPSPDARFRVVKLCRCPLLEAAHQHPEVVCGVHLGVVRGALEELGADPGRTERTALQPFSEPGACRLDLLDLLTR
jgi:predicted ArsR family transcriptional regulator